MSYVTYEISQWMGKPIECYLFQCNGINYSYTSSSLDYTLNDVVYSSVPIKRGAYETSEDTLKSDLDITVIRTVDVVSLFIGLPPEDIVSITIYRIHKGDTEALVYWTGRVTTCTIQKDEATLKCESIKTSLKRNGLRACYQIPCRHTLYSDQCGVSKSSYSLYIANAINNGDGTITHSSFATKADGWWNGGWIQLDTGEKRMVTAHSGSTVTINYPFNSSTSISNGLTVFAGCDSLVTTCNSKFNNVLNFGGFPYIPSDNKFTGDKVM